MKAYALLEWQSPRKCKLATMKSNMRFPPPWHTLLKTIDITLGARMRLKLMNLYYQNKERKGYVIEPKEEISLPQPSLF